MQNLVPIADLVHFAVDLGKRYLSAGGPTSRLEERLRETASEFNILLDVFATPTGIFITGQDLNRQSPMTLIGRMDSSATDISELIRLEAILDRMQSRELSLTEARLEVERTLTPSLWTKNIHRFSFFSLGFGGSFAHYGDVTSAIFSGIICFLIGFLGGLLGDRWGWSGIFRDFTGCFFALVLSGIVSQIWGLPADALILGTLLLLVPGLSLTNSISELAEHNFLSGTAKLMKSFLILLALGTAFLLATDLSAWFFPGIDFYRWGLQPDQKLWVAVTGHGLVIASFSGVFYSPYRYIPFALIPGFASWWTFQELNFSDVIVLSSFVPAFTVGVLSLTLSRWLQVPSQIFTVPGILSLVPGMLALSSFYVVTNPSQAESGSILLQVLIVAGSIVFGLLTARVPFSIFRGQTPR